MGRHAADEARDAVVLDRDIPPRDVTGGPTGVGLQIVADIALTDTTLAEVGVIDDLVRDEVVSHSARHDIVDQKNMALIQHEVVD